MAGYPRKILSLESAIKEVIKELKDSGLKSATGKSESHFRKCSDPNDPNHNIHHIDSINIDKLCLEKGLGTPMLYAHESILDSETQKYYIETVSNILITMGARIGKLMETTHEAIDPKGDSGSQLSQKEKEKIYSAIKDVEEKITQLKIFVDKKNK
jgi:hypothetical protein